MGRTMSERFRMATAEASGSAAVAEAYWTATS
jgi:hypothetical protein